MWVMLGRKYNAAGMVDVIKKFTNEIEEAERILAAAREVNDSKEKYVLECESRLQNAYKEKTQSQLAVTTAYSKLRILVDKLTDALKEELGTKEN